MLLLPPAPKPVIGLATDAVPTADTGVATGLEVDVLPLRITFYVEKKNR